MIWMIKALVKIALKILLAWNIEESATRLLEKRRVLIYKQHWLRISYVKPDSASLRFAKMKLFRNYASVHLANFIKEHFRIS